VNNIKNESSRNNVGGLGLE